jgi:hypothetical protein
VTFSDFERGIFNKAAEQLNKVHDQLAETRKQSLPKIEMNHYLTQKLLHQHQASHRFWQELARAASSTYTAEGVVAKSQDATSVFRAKA